jgi:hypothetical protein
MTALAAASRTCAGCGATFTPRRTNQRYHSDDCRNAARQRAFYHRRRRLEHDPEAAALSRRADAARELIACDPNVDRFLLLSYVVAPTPKHERAISEAA